MIRITAAVALSFVATAASAAPVYLQCNLDAGGNKQLPWELTLNEDSGTVDWSHPQGSGRDRAMFTAAHVKWGNFTVSRTDLSFTSVVGMGNQPAWVRQGSCKLAPKQARAF